MTAAPEKPRTCLVVCYWTGRPARALFVLLDQLARVPAGRPFDLLVVCNGGDLQPLELPPQYCRQGWKVLQRPNSGWNLGAWEAGWRHAAGYEFYLFLQAECTIEATGWLARYEERLDLDPGVGLVGEHIMWSRMTWAYAEYATRRDLGDNGLMTSEGESCFDRYKRNLASVGIDRGDLAEHLLAVVLFAPASILRAVGGFRYFGEHYLDAISSEIGISRHVAAVGMRLATVGDRPFKVIGHGQWTEGKLLGSGFFERARRFVRRFLPLRRPPV